MDTSHGSGDSRWPQGVWYICLGITGAKIRASPCSELSVSLSYPSSGPTMDPPPVFLQIQLCPSSHHNQEVQKGINNPNHDSHPLPIGTSHWGTWHVLSSRWAPAVGSGLTLHQCSPKNQGVTSVPPVLSRFLPWACWPALLLPLPRSPGVSGWSRHVTMCVSTYREPRSPQDYANKQFLSSLFADSPGRGR